MVDGGWAGAGGRLAVVLTLSLVLRRDELRAPGRRHQLLRSDVTGYDYEAPL